MFLRMFDTFPCAKAILAYQSHLRLVGSKALPTLAKDLCLDGYLGLDTRNLGISRYLVPFNWHWLVALVPTTYLF